MEVCLLADLSMGSGSFVRCRNGDSCQSGRVREPKDPSATKEPPWIIRQRVHLAHERHEVLAKLL